MRKFTIVSALIAAMLAVAPLTKQATAASDGTLGATSSGSTDITLTIPNLVQISGLTDINLGSWSGGNMSGSISFCVYSNTGNYTIMASSANGTGTTFRLNQGVNFIPYEVDWTDSAPTTANLDHAVVSASVSAVAASSNCGGGTNTSLLVTVQASDLGAAPPSGTPYSDTLTLLVTPV